MKHMRYIIAVFKLIFSVIVLQPSMTSQGIDYGLSWE